MKKRFIILYGIIVLSVIILIITLNTRVSSTINISGETLPIIDEIIGKRHIKKEEGKDDENNPYIVLYYDIKDIDEDDITAYESMLYQDWDFKEIDDDFFDEGKTYIGLLKEKDQKWKISIFYLAEEVFIKYTKIDVVVRNKNAEDFKESERTNEAEENNSIVMIGNEKFPKPYNEDIKVISEWKGKDEKGNDSVILKLNQDIFDEDEAYGFKGWLVDYNDYFELENGDFSKEYQLASHAEDPEKTLVISIHRDEESAYIKYSVCNTSSIDLTKLGDDYEQNN